MPFKTDANPRNTTSPSGTVKWYSPRWSDAMTVRTLCTIAIAAMLYENAADTVTDDTEVAG